MEHLFIISVSNIYGWCQMSVHHRHGSLEKFPESKKVHILCNIEDTCLTKIAILRE